MSRKKPKVFNSPEFAKKPRVDPAAIKSANDENPVWQIGTLDVDGPWGWKNIEKSSFFSEILPKVQNFESMMWKDILNRNSHEVNIGQISKAAQKRLSELKLDDFETIVSLRFTGKERLWGIRVRNILKLIWWDPNHEIYPSVLKHT
jgi:hypothetical protein